MDPRKILFTTSAPRTLPPDPKNEGLACEGCIFRNQRAIVCQVAGSEAIKRNLRDCEPDQFGQSVVYLRVAIDPRQLNLIEGIPE